MRSSSEPARAAGRATEAALVEKIEELSFLRSLNDRLAHAPDFASACRVLVDLVWEERRVDAVAYLAVDEQRRVVSLEAVAPAARAEGVGRHLPFDEAPIPALLAQREPSVLAREPVPSWLAAGGPAASGTLVAAPTQVRGATTGVLLVLTHGDEGGVEEDRRLLALVAASAALALDAARSQAREEFLATLRHDISNPVAVAYGYTEMIVDRLQRAGEAESATMAASVLELLKVIADLVSNYLHLAAIDRGAPWLRLEDVDLGVLVSEIVEQLRPAASEKGIVVAVKGAGTRAVADRRQLARVIANLVGNAIKYTPGPGRVSVACAADARGASLAVTDTGYGIAPADLPRVFSKYARFHGRHGIPGTGLGLYLSKAIVEAHGGTLEVESAPERGSTFTVRLPPRAA
jgi:signal transduction histidine kinase